MFNTRQLLVPVKGQTLVDPLLAAVVLDQLEITPLPQEGSFLSACTRLSHASIIACIIACDCSGMEPACAAMLEKSFPKDVERIITTVVGEKRLQRLFEETQDFLLSPGLSFKQAAELEYAKFYGTPSLSH